MTYALASPLIPSSQVTVTIPGGSGGLRSAHGATLPASHSVAFGVAAGDTLRLQQLLAQLNYLPVGFTPSGPAPTRADLAQDQAGTFAWRWPGLPSELTSQWTQGTQNQITKAAVEAFETQNNIGVDGIAGPTVWTALINDVINNKPDATPYVYVLVNKAVPQTLTLWNNGVAQYAGIPVNSGAPGADTTDGTFAVFEHVRYSDMKGTNVGRFDLRRPQRALRQLLQRRRRAARVHPLPLRHAAEQRLRRDELRQRRPGVAAHPDRDAGDRDRPGLRHRTAADHDDDDDAPAATTTTAPAPATTPTTAPPAAPATTPPAP